MAKLFGVGVGPGDPDFITYKALKTIEKCAVIATPQTKQGSTLALDIAQIHTDLSDKKIIKLGFAMERDKSLISQKHKEAAAEILHELKLGNNVAFLNLGDLSIYATYHYIQPFIAKAGFACVMIPGIPAYSAIAARLGLNLTPEMNSPVHIIPAASDDLAEVLDLPGAKIIMKTGKNIDEVKRVLKEKGLYESAFLVSDCGLETERVYRSLDEAQGKLSYFSTMVVLPS